jgi:hypothetical protein
MTDDLPTARTMATTGFRWHVFCKSCHWAIDADFQQLIADGRGDVRLIHLNGVADGVAHGLRTR